MHSQIPNPALLPSFVAQHSIDFELDDSTAWTLQFPGILLPESLSKAVRKRQAEFLAGRHCVREALRALRHPNAERPVASGRHREPLWPVGIVGSITHTDRYASASVARSSDARGIGVDAERIVSDERARQLEEQIAGPGEIANLVAATGWPVAEVFTLAFSAKEAIFKCLYPEVRRYFDFHAVRVRCIDADRRRFSAELLQTLTPSLPIGYPLAGTFARDETLIFTALVLPA